MDHRTIITELGGIRELARKLGHTHHTRVQGWADRNRIPSDHWPDLIRLAETDGKQLTSDDLLKAMSAPSAKVA